MQRRLGLFIFIMVWVNAVLAFVLAAAIAHAEVTCDPCANGFSVDIALDADTILACSPNAGDPDATRMEYEITYENGTSVIVEALPSCYVVMPLFTDLRVHTHARYCDAVRCANWAPYGPWAQKLGQPVPACVGDLDSDGDVDGDDFIIFRGAFGTDCAE